MKKLKNLTANLIGLILVLIVIVFVPIYSLYEVLTDAHD